MPPLPLNITAKDRARKYPYSMFHVDDGLLFCNVGIDCLRHLHRYSTKPPSSLLVFNLTFFFRDAQCTASSVVILIEHQQILHLKYNYFQNKNFVHLKTTDDGKENGIF